MTQEHSKVAYQVMWNRLISVVEEQAQALVRTAFSTHGGTMGETNSVAFMFERVGRIVYSSEAGSADEVFEAAVEAGAMDVASGAEEHEIFTSPEDFSDVRDALTERFGDPQAASLDWRPTTTTPVDEDAASTLIKLMDVLDDNDDVQRVAANFEISDDVMAKLTA